MGILIWIIMGGLIGWAVTRFTRRQESVDYVANIIVGIVGAFVGGFVANLVTRNPVFSLNGQGFLVALLATVVFIGVLNAIRRE